MIAPRSRSLEAVIASLTADTAPYLSCDDCFEQIAAYVERLLSDPGHREQPIDRHLAGCAACEEDAGGLLELLRSGAPASRSGAGSPATSEHRNT
jgi:hypothetical protein